MNPLLKYVRHSFDTDFTVYPKAGFWVRFLAATFDCATYVFVLRALIVILDRPVNSLIEGNHIGVYFVALGFLYLVLGLLIFFWPTYRFGGSLGKLLFGIQVISNGGQALSFWQTMLRECLWKPLSYLSFGAGHLIILLHPEKKAFHDLLTGTSVVILREKVLENS